MSPINSISDFLQQQNPYADLIQQLMRIESQDKLMMEARQKEISTKTDSINDVESTLSGLLSSIESLSSPLDTSIGSLSASSSTDAIEIISGEGLTSAGSFTVEVEQLAKQSLVHSTEFVASGTALTGGVNFEIAIGDSAATQIQVAADPSINTTEEMLVAISDKINATLGDKVQASVFQTDGEHVQLVIKSLETGEDNRIQITQQSPFMALNQQHPTAGDLNAKFTIDGIAFERSDNLIDNVITGLTFELKNPTTGDEEIEITQDLETSKKDITDFIEKFNAVNKTIRDKTYVDGQTNERGILYGMRSIRNLTYTLREIGFQQVDSLKGTDISMLADIGIDFRTDGEMYIADEDKLNQALKMNPEAVKELFSADDGIAAKLQGRIDAFITGNDSILETVEAGLDRQIDRLDTKIQNEEQHLKRYEKQLRAEYARLQQVISAGQNQMNRFYNMQSQMMSY